MSDNEEQEQTIAEDLVVTKYKMGGDIANRKCQIGVTCSWRPFQPDVQAQTNTTMCFDIVGAVQKRVMVEWKLAQPWQANNFTTLFCEQSSVSQLAMVNGYFVKDREHNGQLENVT